MFTEPVESHVSRQNVRTHVQHHYDTAAELTRGRPLPDVVRNRLWVYATDLSPHDMIIWWYLSLQQAVSHHSNWSPFESLLNHLKIKSSTVQRE